MKPILFILTVITASLFLSAPAAVHAADFHVTTPEELQTALSTAGDNGADDIVFLAAGTYVGNYSFQTGESRALTIKPELGLNPGQVILDGGGMDRVLNLNAGGNEVSFTIEKLTIQNGTTSSQGSGIYINTTGIALVDNCTFKNNRLSSCLYLTSASSITISNSIITSNNGYGINMSSAQCQMNLINNSISENSQAGLYIDTANTIALNNNIINNNGYRGVDMYFADNVNIVDNIITGNDYIGLYSYSCKNITIDNNIIQDNSTDSYGAGIYIYDNSSQSNLMIENNEIVNNTAGINQHGGGVYLVFKGSTFINNNIITGNIGGGGGGGIYLNAGAQSNIINNTISENTGGPGGGLYINIPGSSEVVNVYNNIIWGNITDGDSDDIYLTGYGSSKRLFNNDYHEMVGLWDFSGNNIDVAPLFADAANGDYHLSAVSLCIDVGANDAPDIPETDLEGNPRIANGTVDLGAFEHSTTDFHPADANENWIIETDEFTAYGNAWRAGITWETGPNPIPIDYVTRAGFLKESGGSYHNEGGGKPGCWVPGSGR